ncbi:MAG: methyltransferase domain-containing protein [Ignavibacteriae bacterium]|nr:methyltransferase domain-containing protein [Ignavibacteriota bacterium]
MKTPQYIQYYDMHGNFNRGFLHPGGKQATEKLLSFLPQLGKESIVVEIGCGTGETAKLLLERFPYSYIGLDAAPAMLDKAKSALSPYSDRVSLIKCDLRVDLFPVPAESIDAIIAESVIAILAPQTIFRECYRVLKRGGILAWNDRLWGETVSPSDRLKINKECKRLLGFPAAPDDLPKADDWKNLMESCGFKILLAEKLLSSTHVARLHQGSVMPKRTKLVHLLVNLNLLRFWYYDRAIERKYRELWQKMENWIFVAKKG